MQKYKKSNRCPVCETKFEINDKTCNSCSFTDRLGMVPVWINHSDAENWIDEVVIPFRKHWELVKKISELTTVDNDILRIQSKIVDEFSSQLKNLTRIINETKQEHNKTVDNSTSQHINSDRIQHETQQEQSKIRRAFAVSLTSN